MNKRVFGLDEGRVMLLAGMVAAIALMFLLSDYQLHKATQILVYTVAILSVNFLSGYNGQVSLGHGAFLAIGAYATAILVVKLGIPIWFAIPIGGLVSMAVGFLIGFPALRLELLYLAMATFSLAVVVPQFAKNRLVDKWTGGVQGLTLPKPAAWSAIGLNLDQTIFLYAVMITAAAFLIVLNLMRGRVGRALEAIREQPLAADTMGIDSRRYKTSAFAVSALLAGTAGGVGAAATQFVAPDSFAFFLSISLLLGAVIGGFQSIYGALLGGAFVVLMPNYAEDVSQGAPWAIYGIVTILLMFIMPQGIAGFIRAARSRLMREPT
jgi:branched-chain amino acid transport system permease protein